MKIWFLYFIDNRVTCLCDIRWFFSETSRTETRKSLSKNIKITSNYWFEEMNQMLYHDMNWRFRHRRFFHRRNNFQIKILTMNASKINWKNWMTMISIFALKKKIRKESFKRNSIVFICRWVLKSNVSNMQFFSIDFCFLFEINSNWSSWRWLYKFTKQNSINCFIRNVCCNIFSSMLSMTVNWTISIEYVRINNNCELIFIKTSWIV